MKGPLDLSFSSIPGAFISPSQKLSEHSKQLLAITDFQERLQYYNDHICSLAYGVYEGLHLFGQYEYFYGLGDFIFIKAKPDENPEFGTYLQVRQKEIDRLKALIGKQKGYADKLKCFIEAKAGQLRVEMFELKVESNAYEKFIANGGGTVPDHLLGNNAEIDLRPTSPEERKSYNLYLYNYVQELIKEPPRFHWLVEVRYEGFLSASAIGEFKQQLSRAFDEKEATIITELDRVKAKFRYNLLSDFRELLYPYKLENLALWQAALFNAFVKGVEFDFSRRELSVHEMQALVHVEQTVEYLKELHKLKKETQEIKKQETEVQVQQVQIQPKQPDGSMEDVIKLIIERGKLRGFLYVPAPDLVHEGAFYWHDENDKPIDCNVYHPKYGYPGFKTYSNDIVAAGFGTRYSYKDYNTRETIYAPYYQQMLCSADGLNFTNKDGKKVVKVPVPPSPQRRLAENETDFEAIWQREFEARTKEFTAINLRNTAEAIASIKSGIKNHVEDLKNLHKAKCKYEELNHEVLASADRFLNYLQKQEIRATHREIILVHNLLIEANLAEFKTSTQWESEGGAKRKQAFYTLDTNNKKKYRPPNKTELENAIERLKEYPAAQKIAINKLDVLRNS